MTPTMRPPSAIQRGSVQFLALGPGDPSTPGHASTPGVERLTRDEMETVPRIPSLPISYGEAEKILRHLGGSVVPDGWQGGLPFAYHVGPEGAVVYDVFAPIRQEYLTPGSGFGAAKDEGA